jgi:hypothetical protein
MIINEEKVSLFFKKPYEQSNDEADDNHTGNRNVDFYAWSINENISRKAAQWYFPEPRPEKTDDDKGYAYDQQGFLHILRG